MKISGNGYVEIEKIKIGEVFIYVDNPYIKIEKGEGYEETSPHCLTLNLKENTLKAFKSNVLVRPVKAEVIIS